MPALQARVPTYEGAQELLIGILLETLLTGSYIMVALECAMTLFPRHRPRRSARSWYLAVTWIILLVLVLMKSVVDMEMTVRSWSNADGYGKPSSLAEVLLTNLLLVLITSCADIFLTYRVYVVWGFRWHIAIVPGMLCAGEIGTGIYAVYAVVFSGVNTAPTHEIIQNITKGWALYLYFALVANLICTVLIAGRIWWIRRKIKDERDSANDSVGLFVTLVVESAAVYSAIFIPEIVCMQWELPQRYILLNMIGPLVGIVFSYIIIRAARSLEPDTIVVSTRLGFARGTAIYGSEGGTGESGTRLHVLNTLSPRPGAIGKSPSEPTSTDSTVRTGVRTNTATS